MFYYLLNPFIIWLLLNLVAILIMSKRIDRDLYFFDMKNFLKTKNPIRFLFCLFLLYIYLPFTIRHLLKNK